MALTTPVISDIRRYLILRLIQASVSRKICRTAIFACIGSIIVHQRPSRTVYNAVPMMVTKAVGTFHMYYTPNVREFPDIEWDVK